MLAHATDCLTLCSEKPFNHALSTSQSSKEKQMFGVSRIVARHGVIRNAAVLAVVAFLAACAQQPPPPPPVQTAPPAPAYVPPARG
jgi:hypothetical protein